MWGERVVRETTSMYHVINDLSFHHLTFTWLLIFRIKIGFQVEPISRPIHRHARVLDEQVLERVHPDRVRG